MENSEMYFEDITVCAWEIRELNYKKHNMKFYIAKLKYYIEKRRAKHTSTEWGIKR